MQNVETLLWEARGGAGREQGLALLPGLGSPYSLSCCALWGVSRLGLQLPT